MPRVLAPTAEGYVLLLANKSTPGLASLEILEVRDAERTFTSLIKPGGTFSPALGSGTVRSLNPQENKQTDKHQVAFNDAGGAGREYGVVTWLRRGS